MGRQCNAIHYTQSSDFGPDEEGIVTINHIWDNRTTNQIHSSDFGPDEEGIVTLIPANLMSKILCSDFGPDEEGIVTY